MIFDDNGQIYVIFQSVSLIYTIICIICSNIYVTLSKLLMFCDKNGLNNVIFIQVVPKPRYITFKRLKDCYKVTKACTIKLIRLSLGLDIKLFFGIIYANICVIYSDICKKQSYSLIIFDDNGQNYAIFLSLSLGLDNLRP